MANLFCDAKRMTKSPINLFVFCTEFVFAALRSSCGRLAKQKVLTDTALLCVSVVGPV